MSRSRRAGLVAAITLLCGPVVLGSSSIYMPVERLAAISPLVVEGRVARTGSGYDPATGALSTYVTVDVAFVHRGPAGLDRVILREPGGRFGDLVHVVDSVPVFTPGENVLLFLEPAKDKALRVAGMFFGKLSLVDAPDGRGRIARRDLSGAGLMPGRAAAAIEDLPAAELDSVIASVGYEPKAAEAAPAWTAVPPELSRLRWDDVSETPGGDTVNFVPISTGYPARWSEADLPAPVNINIQPSGNPMNDAAAAVAAIARGMTAWTDVPEARIVLQPGDVAYGFTASNAQSPSAAYPPVNIVLFDDPYGSISDPSGCTGTLAIGGYWRSGSAPKVVNGVSFYSTLRQYVIFNNNFQCFLGNADNLAEVAAHELGHGIGFGHSTVADSIMRAYAYGNGRGPRLGDDDRDGAHCHYPHVLALTAPSGGESWPAGTAHTITWSTSAEAGPDPGTLDVEYSPDGGTTWSALGSDQPNDGSFAWTIAATPTSAALVRVIRHNRLASAAPYPEACSQGVSDAPFSIVAAAPVIAGTTPDGSHGVPLRLGKGTAGALTMIWGASCSGTATNYAIYEGSLSSLRSGIWNHVPKTCAAGSDLAETITPAPASSYYLVAPLASAHEGLLGASSLTGDRPASASACAPREASSCQ